MNKKRSKFTIDSFILTHFNDWPRFESCVSGDIQSSWFCVNEIQLLPFYNYFLYIVELSYIGNTLIFLCNFCLFVVASCPWTSMIRLMHESKSSLALAFVGEKGIFFLEQGPSTHRNYIFKKLHKLFADRTWQNFYFISLHIKKVFWKSSIVNEQIHIA